MKSEKKNISLELFGLDSYFVNFTKLYTEGNFPKVLLLTGDKGIGKFTLSFHLINYFLSKNTKNPYNHQSKTIDKENIIYKYITSNICENYHYVSNENQNKTSIDNIRELKKKLNGSTLNNFPRFIVFDDVELLNLNSANSLLKLIEEPSDANYFILIYNKKNPIIETLKSRAIETKLFLSNVTKKEIFIKLLNYNNLQNHFSHKYINYTTPGYLLEYSQILFENNIDYESNFYNMTSKFLDKFKKTKNERFLDCINFFLEIKSSEINKKNAHEFIKSLFVKNNIMKLLYNYKKFNLTNNSVLEYIKTSNNYYVK